MKPRRLYAPMYANLILNWMGRQCYGRAYLVRVWMEDGSDLTAANDAVFQ